MTYKYQIKKGFENSVIANAKNLGGGLVESDHPLHNALLTLIKDEPVAPVAPIQQPAPAPLPQPKTEEKI